MKMLTLAKVFALMVVAAVLAMFSPTLSALSLLPIVGMANETTTTTLTEVIRQAAYAESALYFAEKPGLSDFVAFKDITDEETLVGRFPIYDKVSAGAIAEGSDYTTKSAIDTSGSVDVTVSEHQIRFDVTFLTLGATIDQIAAPTDRLRAKADAEGGLAGKMAAEALQRLQDQDIAALYSAFNSSTGSNTGAMTTTLFLAALTLLNVNNVPEAPRVCALHPTQWGHLLPVLDDASVYGAQGQEIVASGVVGRVYGVTMFQTANIGTATVSASTVHAGAVFHPTAVALAQKGQLGGIAAEMDESSRLVELHSVGVWGEAEYRGGATTNGRGGAGVFLYSNSTAQ